MREFFWNCYLLVWWIQRAITPQLEQSLSQARADLISVPVEVCECIPLPSFSASRMPFLKRFSPPTVLGGSLGSSLLKVNVWRLKLSIVLIPFPFPIPAHIHVYWILKSFLIAPWNSNVPFLFVFWSKPTFKCILFYYKEHIDNLGNIVLQCKRSDITKYCHVLCIDLNDGVGTRTNRSIGAMNEYRQKWENF